MKNDSKKTVLITGTTRFIGYYTSKRLTEEGFAVTGLDNINDYYSVDLKYSRLLKLGVDKNAIKGKCGRFV